jgi:hypothetical protein
MLDPESGSGIMNTDWSKAITAVHLPVDHVIGDPASLPQRGSKGQAREYIPAGSNKQF